MKYSPPLSGRIPVLFVLACAGCAGPAKPVMPERDAGAEDASGPPARDGGTTAPPEPECPPTNPFCGDGEPISPPKSCGEETLDLTPGGVQVMFVVDGSSSMEAHWETVANALSRAVESYGDINFGLHMFYSDEEALDEDLDGDLCGADANVVIDVDPDNGQNLIDTLGPQPPGWGNVFLDASPVVQSLNYYLENDTKLSNPDTTNYLVLISDGNDNCFGTFAAGNRDKNAAYGKIAMELEKRHIRVLPIGFDAATGMIGWNGEVQTNEEALDILAAFGGTGRTEALAADDPEELEEAVASVGQLVTPCRFAIPATLDPDENVNAFELTFLLNGMPVPRDRTNTENWNFVNGDTSQVEFRADACTAIRAGQPLEARLDCSDEPVCGTAASVLETRGRAIQFALDGSISMAAAEDPLCTALGGGCLTYWGQAVAAITDALVLPVNDDAEFGLQFFPEIAELEDVGGCDVAPQPEVPPGASSEVTIIQKMLENLPLGSTPLVQVVETTADRPGRLADPDVSGALIVIGDGEHALQCGELADSAEAAGRLGEAARRLHDESGVRVYAIKFGTAADAAVEDQLNAIASNGGTDSYRTALTGEELTAVLEEISEELATCEIDVDLGSPDADPEKLNIYLNGSLIPRDEDRADGWYWVDPDAKTSVELHGEACMELKQARRSNLVVEFGCQAIDLI